MSTVMEVGAMAPGATGMQRVATPSRRTTTLYDLIAALQDMVGPGPDSDVLVVATVVHLLRSGRLTVLGTATRRRRRL